MNIHEQLREWELVTGQELFQKSQIPRTAIAIDFGCGYGEYAIALSRYLTAGMVYAVDRDKKALSILKKKMQSYAVKNIEMIQNNGAVQMPFENEFADFILFYDVIHSNDIKTKMPQRFKLLEDAYRSLKPNGILSIAPFHECDRMRDKQGKPRNYTKEQVGSEIESFGFTLQSEIEGAIHFEKYHSDYQWRLYNNDMQFSDLETGCIWNYEKRLT